MIRFEYLLRCNYDNLHRLARFLFDKEFSRDISQADLAMIVFAEVKKGNTDKYNKLKG